MQYELRRLTTENGIEEYNMLQEIGSDEYGFTNEVNGMTYEQYREWLEREDDYSRGENLPENWIPQTTYFLYAEGEPVGIARIRHRSSEALEKRGVGNFGYGIAKPYRGKGYGNILFQEVIKKCGTHGYTKIRSFVHIDNIASNKVFIRNGAAHVGIHDGIKNIYETTVIGYVR